MIKEGAHVFLSPEDFVEDLKELLPQKMERALLSRMGRILQKENMKNVSANNMGEDDHLAKEILEVMDFYPRSIEQISELLYARFHREIRQEELSSKLMLMCLYGLIKQESGGWFSKNGG